MCTKNFSICRLIKTKELLQKNRFRYIRKFGVAIASKLNKDNIGFNGRHFLKRNGGKYFSRRLTTLSADKLVKQCVIDHCSRLRHVVIGCP